MTRTLLRQFNTNGVPIVVFLGFAMTLAAWKGTAVAATIVLDANTPATGSTLGSQPLITPQGTITFAGEIRDPGSDPEFIAAGATGNVFDIADVSATATMTFGFDVQSITFIYGGNDGVFNIVARNISGTTVASFFQASTSGGQPAGPITRACAGIRSIFWQDPGFVFSAIDNLTIVSVPEPMSGLMAVIGLVGSICCGPRLARKR